MEKYGATNSANGSPTDERSSDSIESWAKLVAELQEESPSRGVIRTFRPTGLNRELLTPIGSGIHVGHSEFYRKMVSELKSCTEQHEEQTLLEDNGPNFTESLNTLVRQTGTSTDALLASSGTAQCSVTISPTALLVSSLQEKKTEEQT